MNNAIRGIALNNAVRILGINSVEITREVQQKLDLSPCASAALGRTMSITALIGLMQKNEDKVLVTIDGNGPIGKIHTQYLGDNKIRGYVDNPRVETVINEQKKLDVKSVVGTQGTLSVIIKQGLKHDYYGSVPLVSGEISEDFTYYFASSEQTPSVVSAGVLVDKDESIISSGAIIIQLLPDAQEKDIQYVESCLDSISNLSKKLENNISIESFIKEIFPDFELLESSTMKYECLCSYDDMYSKISTLSIEDLTEIKDEDHGIETVCPWCNDKFWFNEETLEEIIQNKLNR
ncbi:molecular chaperone Hsp33 [Bacilli bacterium PM5-3]|nr:molecular chaperone Hsp33 [Bacilli bacterium PM5-3]